MNTHVNLTRPLALASMLMASALTLPGNAAAQTDGPDARWLPWLGCWQAVDVEAPASAGVAQAPTVCVIPASSQSAVEVVTVANGAITSRDRVEASGQQRPRRDDGCSGSEQAEWAQDGRRLYRLTEHTCPGGIQRRSTELMAMLPSGEWLSAQGVSVSGNTDVRVLRYRPVPHTGAIPAEITRVLDGRALAVHAARTGAAATPTTQDIVEASKRVDADVVGAWLIERGEGFAVDARKLIELADAGVPEPVIDLMVALSYPKVFAINSSTQEGELRPGEQRTRPMDMGRRRPGPIAVMDTWGYYPGYGWGYYPGYNYYRGGYYGRPVVIVRGPEEDESRPRARAVKGRGYTRGSGDSAGSSTPRPSTGSSSGSGTSTERSGSGSESSGSSSSGSGRTAKPRPDTK